MGVCDSETEKRHAKQRKPVQLNQTESAILECKTCRDKIKQYIKRLNQRENKCREKAKTLLRSKERERAKIYLRQAKLHKEQVRVSEGQLEMVENQISQIESTQNLQQCHAVLKQGNAVLSKLQNTMKIEEWEKIRDDMDELKEKDQEISDYLKEYGINEVEYNEEVDQELDKLLREVGADNTGDLPNVPKEEITESKSKVKKVNAKKKVVAA